MQYAPARMLARARERGIYSRLEQHDLVPWMHSQPQHADDLVIAADVFICFTRLKRSERVFGRTLHVD